MTYKFADNVREEKIIDKLNALSNAETFYDDVRKLTKNVRSDRAIHTWQVLSDQRYAELITGVEDVRQEFEPIKLDDGRIKFVLKYYDANWNEVELIGSA